MPKQKNVEVRISRSCMYSSQKNTESFCRAIYICLRIDDALIGFMLAYAITKPWASSHFWCGFLGVLPLDDS